MNILPFRFLITRFLLHARVLLDIVERVREPMRPINNSTLSRSTGQSRLHLCGPILDSVDTQRDGHPRDRGVSADETSTQAEASRTSTLEEKADILCAEISG
ncbi:hypothetical protein F2P56_002320 [Juglans regia]|nr:hypothetical protein F2P56_002320 [Juglans regia]